MEGRATAAVKVTLEPMGIALLDLASTVEFDTETVACDRLTA
jgi:hypothetical protein